MAFKMKNNPFKQEHRGSTRVTYPKATQTTTTKKKMGSDYVRPIGPRDEDGGFTTIENEDNNSELVSTTVYDGGHSGNRPAPTFNEEIDNIYKEFDLDGSVGFNDKERNAFIKAMGLTSEEVSGELNRLAEVYGDDDYDEGQYIAAVLALSKKKKSLMDRADKQQTSKGDAL